jgi:hypothetical protein
MRLGNQVTNDKFRVETQKAIIEFEYVEEFIYLGTLLNSDCSEEKEINHRIMKANKSAGAINHLVRSKHLSRKSKLRLYNTILKPTILYSCETWVLNKKQRESVIRWERKVLRRILGGKKVEGVYMRRTNEDRFNYYIKNTSVVRAHRKDGRRKNSETNSMESSGRQEEKRQTKEKMEGGGTRRPGRKECESMERKDCESMERKGQR